MSNITEYHGLIRSQLKRFVGSKDYKTANEFLDDVLSHYFVGDPLGLRDLDTHSQLAHFIRQSRRRLALIEESYEFPLVGRVNDYNPNPIQRLIKGHKPTVDLEVESGSYQKPETIVDKFPYGNQKREGNLIICRDIKKPIVKVHTQGDLYKLEALQEQNRKDIQNYGNKLRTLRNLQQILKKGDVERALA